MLLSGMGTQEGAVGNLSSPLLSSSHLLIVPANPSGRWQGGLEAQPRGVILLRHRTGAGGLSGELSADVHERLSLRWSACGLGSLFPG